jgi:hypothetical protein
MIARRALPSSMRSCACAATMHRRRAPRCRYRCSRASPVPRGASPQILSPPDTRARPLHARLAKIARLRCETRTVPAPDAMTRRTMRDQAACSISQQRFRPGARRRPSPMTRAKRSTSRWRMDPRAGGRHALRPRAPKAAAAIAAQTVALTQHLLAARGERCCWRAMFGLWRGRPAVVAAPTAWPAAAGRRRDRPAPIMPAKAPHWWRKPCGARIPDLAKYAAAGRRPAHRSDRHDTSGRSMRRRSQPCRGARSSSPAPCWRWLAGRLHFALPTTPPRGLAVASRPRPR